MRHNIKLVLLIILIAGAAMFCGSRANTSKAKDLPPDFRKVNWEMNKADVKSVENGVNLVNETDSELTYQISQFNCETTVKYFFKQNILDGCLIDFGPPITDKNKFSKVSGEVQRLLVKKYGVFDKNGAEEISGGYNMYNIWNTDRSQIKSSTIIKNGAAAIIIKYIKNLPNVTGGDINGLNWGITPEQVKAKENKRLTMVEDVKINTTGGKEIKYEETLAGVPTMLYYYFKEDKLHAAEYRLEIKHTAKGKYAEDFIKLNDWLIKKHNSPDSTTASTKDYNNYTGSKQNWPFDFSSGYLKTISSEWDLRRTKITVHLISLGTFINLKVDYSSKLKFQSKRNAPLPPEADNI